MNLWQHLFYRKTALNGRRGGTSCNFQETDFGLHFLKLYSFRSVWIFIEMQWKINEIYIYTEARNVPTGSGLRKFPDSSSRILDSKLRNAHTEFYFPNFRYLILKSGFHIVDFTIQITDSTFRISNGVYKISDSTFLRPSSKSLIWKVESGMCNPGRKSTTWPERNHTWY